MGLRLGEAVNSSPVRGFRTCLSGRSFTEKLPNPLILISSPCLRDFSTKEQKLLNTDVTVASENPVLCFRYSNNSALIFLKWEHIINDTNYSFKCLSFPLNLFDI